MIGMHSMKALYKTKIFDIETLVTPTDEQFYNLCIHYFSSPTCFSIVTIFRELVPNFCKLHEDGDIATSCGAK
jgi:hypothetical protein